MKTLYLLRHAKSDWAEEGLDDHERRLAPRGRRACVTLGALLSELAPPELAWCSSAIRTRETFTRTRDHWQQAPRLEVTDALYLAGPSAILEVLGRTDPAIERVLLVGHNPGLQQLAIGLTHHGDVVARERAHRKFPTGALATVEIPTGSWELAPESGALTRFVTPRDLR